MRRFKLKGLAGVLLCAFLIAAAAPRPAAGDAPLIRGAVDIIFVIDYSGSMDGEISKVMQYTSWFADQLVARGYDWRLGLVPFADTSGPLWYPPFYGFYTSVSSFVSKVQSISTYGGYEPTTKALEVALNAFLQHGRPSAGRMIILITDEPIQTRGGPSVTSIAQSLGAANVIVNIIAHDSSGAATIHSYTRGRFYSLGDSSGSGIYPALSSILDQIGVNRPPQITSVSYSPSNPYFKNLVTLMAAATDPDGDPLTYVWTATKPNGQQVQLGQGSTVTFTPDMPGAWTVTVTVHDPYGALASSTLAVNVLNHPPQITSVAWSPSSPFINNPVLLTTTATDADGDPLMYFWIITMPNGQLIQFGQASTAIFTPNMPGTWTVTVTATDPWGGSASASCAINVAAYELSAALEPNPAMRGQKVRVYAALTVPAPPSAAQHSGYRASPYDEVLEAEGGQAAKGGSYGYSPDGKVVWLFSGWLEARFAKPATAVYVQFNSSDSNDGYAKVYVDGTYYGSFQTQNKGHNYVRVGNLPATAHAVRVENSGGHLHIDFFGAASEPADGARTAADSAYVVLPDGRQAAMGWDPVLQRHWAEFLVPDGGSPGVWPGDGTYAVKVRAAKYGVAKEVSLSLTIQGNVKEKMYIRTLEW